MHDPELRRVSRRARKADLWRDLPRILSSAVRSRLGLRPRWVDRELLGRTLRVRDGTIADGVDYDYAWLYALITQCSVLFDIGCNVGFVSLLACSERASCRVLGVDANPAALAIAKENLRRNCFADRCSFVSAFVGDSDDNEIAFYTVGAGAAGSRFASHSPTASAQGSSAKVRTVTIDSLARDSAMTPDLIKIDVEGAEADALRGASSTAREAGPIFMVEMHATAERSMEANGSLALTWCRDVKYDAYYLKAHRLVRDTEIFSGRGRCHLLLQPAGRRYPESLRDLAQGDTLERAVSVIATRA